MKETKPYPAAPITIIPIELWSDEKQDQYIAGRVKLHQDAEYERLTGGSLPLCSDLERWARPSTWAVKKTANKRAMRVFDSEQEAEEYFNDKNLDKKCKNLLLLETAINFEKYYVFRWIREDIVYRSDRMFKVLRWVKEKIFFIQQWNPVNSDECKNRTGFEFQEVEKNDNL